MVPIFAMHHKSYINVDKILELLFQQFAQLKIIEHTAVYIAFQLAHDFISSHFADGEVKYRKLTKTTRIFLSMCKGYNNQSDKLPYTETNT